MKCNMLSKSMALGAAAALSSLCAEVFAQIDEGRYHIVSRHSGLAVTIEKSSTSDGANVVQNSLTGDANQQFDVTNVGNGYYSIRPVHSDKSLDVYNFSVDPGGEIRQWSFTGGDNQQWQILDLGTGYYKVVSRHSGLALDVWEWSTSNGGDIRQWDDIGADNQQWNFQKITADTDEGDWSNNLALGAGADGSSKGGGTSYGNVVDGNTATYWQPSSTSGERISVKNVSASFDTVVVRELNGATTGWRLTDHDTGAVLASGSGLGSEAVISGFGEVSLYKVNLIIDNATSAPQIAEIELYNSGGGSSSSSSSSSSTTSTTSSSSSGSSGSSSSSSSAGSTSSSSSSSSSTSSSSGMPGDSSGACLDSPIGFASLAGGTTGGAGGTSVTVTNGQQLAEALSNHTGSSTPLTIYVNGTINQSNSNVSKFDVKDMENISIIGVGNSGVLDGIGIKVWRANNVIIRNLTIRYVREGEGDGISVEGPSNNVWIDHNTLYNSLDVDKDHYDGLVDVTRNSNNISITYNHLHSSWKTALTGHSDGNSDNNRRITYAFNRWENVFSRTPLIRYSDTHLFNNYYNNILDTGINSRMGARVRIDNNVFENSENPIVSCYSSEIGYWDLSGNAFSNINWEGDGDCVLAGPNLGSTISYNPPYAYSPLPASQVKNHVLQNAGAGRCSF